MSMLRREHVDVDMVVRTRRETVEQGEAMSNGQWKKEEKEKKEGQRERERGGRVWRKRRRQKERQRKEDGRILCQSLIKKELGTDSAVLGTGQTPVASPSCTVPVCMVLLNTVTEDRVQAHEGLLRFLVQTLLALLRLILLHFFYFSISFSLFHPLFLFLSLLRSSALFDSHLPFLSS